MLTQNLLAQNDVLNGTRAAYKILGVVGRGGMGAVYRAMRLADNTIWALKEMRPPDDAPANEIEENKRLFFQEAELLRALSHPNLPLIADFFDNNGRPTMVMEFIQGQTLEDYIRDTNAPLLEQQALKYGIQVARVLHYLHTRTPPIIYRDMKPSNVMVTPEGVVKLIDFGVARTYKARKSKDTVAMGSAGYAPKEQYGKGQTDARSDVYALGATLLHLVTNMPPIPLQTPAVGSIRKINKSIHAKTEQAIIKAMAMEASDRFQTMADFEKALTARLDGPFVDPVTRATPPPPVIPPGPAFTPPPTASAQPATNGAAAGAGGQACSTCGRLNKPNARFCAGCGSPLGQAAVAIPRLLIRSPRGSWEKRLDTTPVRIGRRDPRQNHYPELDLAEHDRGIASRSHALINRDAASFTITDMGSTNGTLLNGAPLVPHQPKPLRSGDRIKIGEIEMEFRWN